MLFHGKNEELQKYLTLTDSFPFMKIQCPLDIAAALAIATSTKLELGALVLHKWRPRCL